MVRSAKFPTDLQWAAYGCVTHSEAARLHAERYAVSEGTATVLTRDEEHAETVFTHNVECLWHIKVTTLRTP